MKWRIIAYSIFRGNIYIQITNDIDTVDYILKEEFEEYKLKNGI